MKKKIICGILAVALVVTGVYFGIPKAFMKKTTYESEVPEEITGNPIDITATEKEVASSNDTSLYFDASTLKFRVVNKKAGTEWCSYMKGTDSGTENALLILNYLGEDNNVYEYNSDTNCAQLDTYEVYSIDNGVKISMDLNEGDSNRFYEFLPKKMSIERYEDTFVKGLSDALAAGNITEEEYKRYSTTLSLVYKKSIVEECYAVTYTGNPPASATKQMISIAQAVGYTHDELEKDADEFGFTVSETEIAEFTLNMYITLEDGDLLVRVPSSEMTTLNDYFQIQNIEVLPNLGAATAAQQEKGYLFVPDGAGALMAFNTFKSGVSDYIRAVYENDYFKDYYYMSDYGQELMMPVYGMIYGDLGSEKQSYLGIIETGAETSYIHGLLASTGDDGASNNKVFSSFDTIQYMSSKVYGPYSDNTASYLVSTDFMNIDYTIRFKFFGKQDSYYDMAKAYQQYLVDNGQLNGEYTLAKDMQLNVIGALDVTEHFIGIPYSKTISMTTYNQLLTIMNELNANGIDASIAYQGVFNNGMNNGLNNGLKLVKANGKKSALKKVRDYASENGFDISFAISPSRVYSGTQSYLYKTSLHALKDYSNKPATIYRYDVTSGKLKAFTNANATYYELLSPAYLEGIVKKICKKAGSYENLYVTDLGNLFYADYDNADMIDAYSAAKAVDASLKALSDGHGIVLDNPFAKNLAYAEKVTGISRKSSDYSTFAYTIPFRQLVLNGKIAYTTENVNMSTEDSRYFVLQAAELGTIPQFTITYEKEDKLKNSDYAYLYSVNYDNLKDEIKAVYDECSSIYEELGNGVITDHKLLADGVFETTYENGTTVVVNYNLYDVNLGNGKTIKAQSYEINGQGRE